MPNEGILKEWESSLQSLATQQSKPHAKGINNTDGQGTPTNRRFSLLTLEDCRAAEPRKAIIKGLLAAGDLMVLVGQPGAGKSVLAPYLAHAVATGRPIFNKRVKEKRVIYIAAEDGAGMRMRMAALADRFGDARNLRLIADTPVLVRPANEGEPPDLAPLKQAMKDFAPELLIVDTLAVAFAGMRENDPQDMGHAVATLRELGEENNAAVIVVHHGPKDGGETPRGHSILWGAADVTAFIKPPGEGEGERSILIGKNRNGIGGCNLGAFSLDIHELGSDEDCDPITAPVAREVVAGARKKAGRPLNEAQTGWYRDLLDMFAAPDLACDRIPVPGMSPTRTLTRDQLRNGFRVRGRLEGDTNGALTANDRRRLHDMLNALRDKGKISMADNLVWLC